MSDERRFAGLRRVFRLPTAAARAHRDVEAELLFHLESRVADLIGQGIPRDDAQRRALREYGDLTASCVELIDVDRRMAMRRQRAGWMDALRRDLSHALRGLARSPGIAIAIAVTLGLGVGANAAIFTVLDPIFLQAPRGVANAGGIRRLYAENIDSRAPGSPDVRAMLGMRDLRDLAVAARGAAWIEGDYLDRMQKLKPGNQPVLLTYVSSGYFGLLGVRPALGRFFTPGENDIGSPAPVAVLSDAFWRSHFGADPGVLGQTVRADEITYTIVGVAPPAFTGLELEAVDLWVPLSNLGGMNTPPLLHLLARLEPDANEASLERMLSVQYRETHRGEPAVGDSSRLIVAPIAVARGPVLSRGHLIPRITDRSLALLPRLAAVSFMVLIIAVANAASLLLMRALRRRREIAIRVALGASRFRLVSQLAVESGILAALGGTVALIVAQWTGSLLRTQLSAGLRWTQTVVDHRALAFAGIAAIVGAAAAGLAPALFALRTDVTSSLKAQWGGAIGAGSRLRVGLLATQAALCTALLACGGVFLQSLRHAGAFDRGFDTGRTIQVAIPAYYANAEAQLGVIAGRLRADAGVETVGRSFSGVAGLGMATKVGPTASDTIGVGSRGPYLEFVEAAFMKAAAMRAVAGRVLSPADDYSPVIVLSESLAGTLFGGRAAVGRCVHVREPQSPCREIVGVVRDQAWDVSQPPPYRAYVPLTQAWSRPPTALIPDYLLVRTRVPATAADVARIRGIVAPMISADATPGVQRVADMLEPQVRPWRLAATLFLILGALGLLAAATGIYGLVAYDVAQRSREIGVRVALGATSTRIIGLVAASGLRVILIGVGAGVIAALSAGRVMASLLFQTSPYDPAVLATTAAVLCGVTLLASALPAWRATRVDPVRALSSD